MSVPTWLTWLLLGVAVVAALALWTAFARCTLASFEATTGMRTRLSGPGAHAEVVAALVGLPGVRLLERSENDVLLSVLPAPAAKGSLDRGWGLYLVVRPVDQDVLLLARRRVPFPGGDLASALRELERAACRDGPAGGSPFADS
ncbi:hypothetical protein [Labedaea rhizosphaerae]|uniref:Uncharacterized protein n=1 Tax=Labedaea rhizosphaerae TaxID=598644 RepID=A0A4R6SAC5_LABRH|nr:hypothetical protein [Labedaea rhizosphaerae]TDP96357.1 hypothetical protein EV186_104342 [Labedaea rhizosphaerae]